MSPDAIGRTGRPGSPAETRHAGEIWSPQTLLKVVPTPDSYNTHFAAYGLGWSLRDVRGYKQVSHSGALSGMLTEVTLVPELRLGIIVLTNQRSSGGYLAVSRFIKDHYLGIIGVDRLQVLIDAAKKGEAANTQADDAVWKQVAAAQKAAPKKPDYRAYIGRYHDAWLGDVNVFSQGNQLWLKATRSPRLTGQLLPYRGDTHVVRWRDRSFTLHPDVYAAFTLDAKGQATRLKLTPISKLLDFSYDFQDLDLQRVAETAPAK